MSNSGSELESTSQRGSSSFGEFGEEEPMGGGPEESIQLQPDPEFREYIDPISGKKHRIVAGRVVIAFANTPQQYIVEPNYFDSEILSDDQYYSNITFQQVTGTPSIDSFIEAEELIVYNEWPQLNGIAVILPPETSVEQAIEFFPIEYPNLIISVEPDYVRSMTNWPITNPNDDKFPDQWNICESSIKHINIQSAWRNGYYGWPSEVIAILDTGVQWSYTDLSFRYLSWGINTGDYFYQFTRFHFGGGSPETKVLEKNAEMARIAGHGTCVAGIISAGINNDGNGVTDEKDICGISYGNYYLPVALELYWDSEGNNGQGEAVFTYVSVVNAYIALGTSKRIFPTWLYPGFVPFSNIEVANCSYGGRESTYFENYLLSWLGNYILFVCSAGNDGEQGDPIFYPARHPLTMCVAGHDRNDVYHEYNYPVYTDILAPTPNILTCDMVGRSSNGFILGYLDAFPWTLFNGTSAAAPHVSAVAGIASSRNRELTPMEIRLRIRQSSTRDLASDYLQRGRLNAYAALTN